MGNASSKPETGSGGQDGAEAVSSRLQSSVLSADEVEAAERFCVSHASSAVGPVLREQGVPPAVVELMGLSDPVTPETLLRGLERVHAEPLPARLQFECFAASLQGEWGGEATSDELELAAREPDDTGDLSAFRCLLVACCGQEKHSAKSGTLASRVDMWKLARWLKLDPRQTMTPLYSSLSNGDGVGAFTRSVAYYESPALLLVRGALGDVVGVYAEAEWVSQAQFFGSGSTRLFAVSPEPKLFPTTNVSHNYLYLHIPSMKATTKGVVPDGVGVGGQMSGFRLHLDPDFKLGEATTFDSTFENGQLVPLAAKKSDDGPDLVTFDIEVVEMIGLGGTAGLTAQEKKKQFEIKEAMKRRQVNKKMMLGGDDEEDPDMWLLETAGAHQSYVKDADHV